MFRGWLVVAGAFGVMFVGYGATYAFSAFFDVLEAEFGATRAEVSLVFSIAGLLYFTLGAISGRLADRVDPRWVIGFGVAVLGGGFLLAGNAASLAGLYVGYGLGVGIGVGFAYVPSIAAVQHWFLRKRGFASGLAVSGIGLGTLVVPPAAALAIAAFGWRDAWLAIGLGVLAIGGVATLFIEASPAKRGLVPDGEAPAAGAPVVAASGLSVGEALRTRTFWTLAGGAGLASLGLFIPFVHLVPYAQDQGMNKADAVLLFSLIGIGSTAGRFVLGGLADRLGRKRAQTLMFAGIAASLAWWGVSTAPWALALFALAFGTFYGGFVAIAPALAADLFGARNVSGIIGVLYASVGFGTLVGPPLAGLAFDLTRSYALPIWTTAFLTLGASVLTATLRPPARPPAQS
jgi:MFS family permease